MTMTLNRLTEIKQKNQELVMVRKLVASQAEEMAKHTAYRKQILVCGGTGCTSSSSLKVIEALEKELRRTTSRTFWSSRPDVSVSVLWAPS